MPTVGIPLLISDSAAYAVVIPTTESCAIDASEFAYQPIVLIGVTDSLAVPLTETSAVVTFTNQISLHILEAAIIAVMQPTTESLSTSLLESPQIGVMQSVSDSLGVGASDATPATPAVIHANDS